MRRILRRLSGAQALFVVVCVVLAFSFAGPACAVEQHAALPAASHETTGTAAVENPSHGAPDAQGAGHTAEPGKPELPTVLSVIAAAPAVKSHAPGLVHFLHAFEYQIFLVLITALALAFIFATLSKRDLIPGRMQALIEIIVEGFYAQIEALFGGDGRKYAPFFASLFMFIWLNNMFGLIPGLTGATSAFETTGSLAAIVFLYYNWQGIKVGGIGHWLWHLCGSPRDAIGWGMVPLMLPIEIISLFAKPLSLALRLFGNIFGEHILSGVFLILGMMMMGAVWPNPPIGVPLHLPFLFLGLLVGTIQALVFTMLSAIYLKLLLPHDDHGHDEGHDAEHAHGDGEAHA
jgi:F-type H+-transporting ATPase subunit a